LSADVEGTSDDMLPAERRHRLIEWMTQNVAATNHELARILNTSISTVRRDLDYLASQGLVRRTHGGAVSIRRLASWEPTTDVARQTAIEEKRAIAAEAAKRIEPNQSILIDTGSTLHIFAQVVAELTVPLTVVTNDVLVASTLSNRPHVKLVVPGGSCRDGAYTLLGEPGLSFLDDLRCDQLFLCSQAVDVNCASDTSMDLVNLKRTMIAAAHRIILMVDSSKFGARAIYRVADIEQIDEIITDNGIAPEELQRMAEAGANITCAKVDNSDGD